MSWELQTKIFKRSLPIIVIFISVFIPFIAAVEKSYAADDTIVLSFVGDCALGDLAGNENEASILSYYYRRYGADYFFKNVKHIFDQSDLSIANCEGVFTHSDDMADKGSAERRYWIKGKPEYADILKSGGIDLVNLANNHTFDYGHEGYRDTVRSLESANVGYFGNEYISVKQIKSVRVGFFGLTLGSVYKGRVDSIINQMRSDNADIIVANFHGGEENSYIPNQRQIDAARLAIDCGADIVIQHHSHVLQGVEYYKNRPIAYSLGNFVFGANRNPSDKRSIIFQVLIDISNNDYKFTHKKIPVMISGCTSHNNFQPVIISPAFRHSHCVCRISEAGAALMAAARGSDREAIAELIESGADADARNDGGSTPLMAAAGDSNIEVIKELINAGADVNARNNHGWTPLMFAVIYNPNPEVITELVNAGADVHAENNNGSTPYTMAVKNFNLKALLALMSGQISP